MGVIFLVMGGMIYIFILLVLLSGED